MNKNYWMFRCSGANSAEMSAAVTGRDPVVSHRRMIRSGMPATRALLTRAGGTVVLACLLVGGCTASGQPTSASGGVPASGLDEAGESLRAARKGGADPWQIAILEKGDVSYSEYESAVNRALTCMRDAGIDVLGPEVTSRTGLPQLHYGWSPQADGLTTDQGQLLGDDCLNRYSYYVEMEYSVQPSSIEAMEQYFVKFRPAVVACLRENGGTVKDEPTRDEAVWAGFPVHDSTGVDCFEQAGLSQS